MRLDPTHRLRADVRKTVNTTYPRPNHIARAEVVSLAIRCRPHAPADDEVGFFKGVIVWVDFCAGLILNEKRNCSAHVGADRHMQAKRAPAPQGCHISGRHM